MENQPRPVTRGFGTKASYIQARGQKRKHAPDCYAAIRHRNFVHLPKGCRAAEKCQTH